MIKDMYDREIQVGDVIVILSGKVHQFQVLSIEEPSALVPQGQIPIGKMTLSVTFDQPIVNPNRLPNLRFNDIAITRKFTELEVPAGTTKQ